MPPHPPDRTDEGTGEEAEREIPFLKGYTVFNVEQIEGLPAHENRSHHRLPLPGRLLR